MGWTRPHLVGIRQSYKYYKQKAEEKPISYNDYIVITGLFMKYIISLVLKGKIVKLPERFGLLYITGKKIEPQIEDGRIVNLNVDWKATNKMWKDNPQTKEQKKFVYHLNEHTNGVAYSIKWNKRNIITPNKVLYSFDTARGFKRSIPRMVREEGMEYPIDAVYNNSKTA